tara:strand:- start:4452 stop:5108 length:657 start_codon:yes stop_codon:yes gene_type:complete
MQYIGLQEALEQVECSMKNDPLLLFSDWMDETVSEKVLYIMRGTPGSGKSWDAKRLAGYVQDAGGEWIEPEEGEVGPIYSADDLISTDPEEYKQIYAAAKRDNSIGRKLGGWHRECMRLTVEAMREGRSPIVVDNTNLKKRDVRPYVEMAIEHGYEVQFQEPTSSWWADIRPWLTQKNNDRALDRAADKLAYRNSHGVPAAAIKGMLQRWQDMKIEDF